MSSSPQQAFWEWFQRNEDLLFNFEADQEPRFNQLAQQLGQIHRDLCFEFGPPGDRREFVISAGGIREAFPTVSSLVAAAPRLERWHVVGFRPRRTPLNTVCIDGMCIEPGKVGFCLLTIGSKIGIQLFIPGFKEDDVTLKQVGYLMLDEALGEYDVETKVGLIKMMPTDSPRSTQRFPLPELPSLFDQLAARFAGATSTH